MISPRYVWVIGTLLLFALVPTVLNVYVEPEPLSLGVLARKIPEPLAGFRGPKPGDRKEEWASRQFGVKDFVTRLYTGGGREYELFATRSYDAKKLFHFPELALSRGREETARRIEEVQTSAGALPAHVIEFASTRGLHMAAYVLLYGDRGVREPILFMFARVPEMFVGKREAMTLIYVQGGGAPRERLEQELKQLLAAACELK